MKKTLFSITLLLISFALFAQSFPEKNPELLLNKIVKPKEINEGLQKYAYKNFFIEFNEEKKQFTKKEAKNKPFPSGPSYSTVSDYSKLVGKKFKVIRILDIVPKYSFSGKEYAIEMENTEIGKIFYKYNPQYESSYELEVEGGLDYPEDYYCLKIEHKKDKFEEKETFYSPYENGISFIKSISNGKSVIYLNIRVNGSTLNVGEKGLNIVRLHTKVE